MFGYCDDILAFSSLMLACRFLVVPADSRYAALHLECNEVLVQRQTQHSEFREFLGKIQLKVKVSLDSLLIAPVQRVPRYILLLKELRR